MHNVLFCAFCRKPEGHRGGELDGVERENGGFEEEGAADSGEWRKNRIR